MIHPSYIEMMQKINDMAKKDNDMEEEPLVNSRYSIVLASAKRARQIIGGSEPLMEGVNRKKPLSTAVNELYEGKVHILGEEDIAEEDITDL